MNGKGFVVVVILLLIGTSVFPITAQDVEKTVSASKGSWLYVGGGGPGNYSKIQDAVDNASDGDTVFVFDDAAPYVENIMINTSLSLIGEDKETTIINGSTNTSGENWTLNFGVWIAADHVTVRGFTIQSCNLSGILISSNNNSITDNILSDDFYGITIGFGDEFQPPSSHYVGYNTISTNLIIRDEVGIYVAGGSKNNITGNSISQTMMGIMLVGSMNSTISSNIISENDQGIGIWISYNTVVYRNNISSNKDGVTTYFTSAVKILQNNFIGNTKNAESTQWLLWRIQLFKKEIKAPLRRNVWSGNYWDGPRSLPYIIPSSGLFLRFRFHVDWHPAQEPYVI